MTRFAVAVVILAAALTGCEDHRSPTDQAAGWFPAAEQAHARCIIWEESRNDPNAVGSAGELGLLQIHPIHRRDFTALTGHPWADARVPVLNGQFGFVLWKQTGWRAWSTARKCGLR